MPEEPGARRRIVVLGASGLIGFALAHALLRRGHHVTAVARSFSPAQEAGLRRSRVVEQPMVDHDAATLADLFTAERAEVVVNCIGVLQNGPRSGVAAVHETFVERLVGALQSLGRPVLLVHVSVPGHEADDRTAFSRSKRRAEAVLRHSGLPTLILRPGFVLAPAAYGGSALLRALAALPFDLPRTLLDRPFAPVAVEDIALTVAVFAERWSPDAPPVSASFDLVEPASRTLRQTVEAFRRWLGRPAAPRLVAPGVLLEAGARAGDLAAWLGWQPPVRTTALAELRRGVGGDPGPWTRTLGIAPRPLESVLAERPATVQDIWFAGLYLLKPLIIIALALFWCATGLITLTVAHATAVDMLELRGIPLFLAHAVTVATCLIDIAVGLAIAVRRTCRAGLVAGIAVSVFYMMGAVLLTPDLWLEPLGALVKTGPAIVLMLVALATLDRR